MQQLIEWSQNDLELFIEDTDEAIRIFKAIKDKATELLETEREQIEDAYDCGHMQGNDRGLGDKTEAEQYYKDTYE